jgi:hypothetical protein
VGTEKITDPDVRAGLDDAERALDAGEYAESVRRSADVFMRVVRKRPDLIVRPFAMDDLPINSGPPQLPPRAPWPDMYGVVFRYDDDGPLEMLFEKDSFTMSEAITIFEYTLDTAIRAERQPPAAG